MPEQEGQEPFQPTDRAPLQWVPNQPSGPPGDFDGWYDGFGEPPAKFGPGGEPPDGERRPRRSWRVTGVAAVVAIVALAAGSVASALGVGINNRGGQTHGQGALRAPTGATRQAAPGELGQIADRDLPEVITIVAVGPESEELGSAWPVDGQGDFITNDHVVHDGLSFHAVTASGDQYPADVIHADPSLDLAEVRVAGLSERAFEVATAPAVIGQPVVVLASRGATDHSPVTESAINGLDQQASVQDAEPGEIGNYSDLIRIPAKIWPGNSGGPVLTEQGSVVGILTLAAENGSGAFAIPLSEVDSVIDQWLQG